MFYKVHKWTKNYNDYDFQYDAKKLCADISCRRWRQALGFAKYQEW